MTTTIQFRGAQASEQATIQRMVKNANINPFGLDWRRFLVAELDGQIVGIGQIKPHGDGSRELASIAVLPAYQKQGIAKQIIGALLADETGVLYLTCRPPLEPFYQPFGFTRCDSPVGLPPYFRRIFRVMQVLRGIGRLFGNANAGGLIMVRPPSGGVAGQA